MPVNPISNVTHYPIEASAEPSEEQRRREKEKENKKEGGEKPFSQLTKEVREEVTISGSEAALASQYVDSGSVIDLLSHRPKPKNVNKNAFRNIKDLTAISDDKKRKKINKTL